MSSSSRKLPEPESVSLPEHSGFQIHQKERQKSRNLKSINHLKLEATLHRWIVLNRNIKVWKQEKPSLRYVAIEWVLFSGSIAFLWRNSSSSLFWSLIDLWGIWGNEWARTFVLLSPTLVRSFCYLLSLVDFDPLGVSWTLFSSSFTFVGIIFIIFQVL